MEDWVVKLAAALSTEFQVSVATYGPCHPVILAQLKSHGVEWFDLSAIEKSLSSARRWIKCHASIAHFSLFAPRSKIVVAAQTVRGTRVIFQDCYSTPTDAGAFPSAASTFADRFTFSRVARVIAISAFVESRLQERFRVDAGKLSMIYNGVDGARFHSVAPPSSCARILCVAALIPDKGVDYLLRAFSMLPETGMRLDICGEGPERARLEDLAQSLGISGRVAFLGMRDDVDQLLQQAAFSVHPATWGEAFGLTIAEAMAAGRAVIGCAVGAVPELILDGVTGFVVPAADADALAESMERLVRNGGLRDQLGSAARARVEERFGMSEWVARHRDAVRQSAS